MTGPLIVNTHLKELKYKTILSGLIKSVKILLGMVSSIVLGRILGPEQYGSYIYLLSSVLIMTVIVQFGFPVYSLRETSKLLSIGDFKKLVFLWRSLHYRLAFLTITFLAAAFGVLYFFKLPGIYFWCFLIVPIFAAERMKSAIMRGAGYVVLGQIAESFAKPFLMISTVLVVYFSTDMSLSAELTIKMFLGVNLIVLLIVTLGWFNLKSKLVPIISSKKL